MSRREDLIQHCRYYHDEVSPPYEDRTKCLFWDLERQWVDNCLRSPDFQKGLERDVREYISANKGEDNILTSDKESIETKEIVTYIEAMLSKWMPQNVDLIFQY